MVRSFALPLTALLFLGCANQKPAVQNGAQAATGAPAHSQLAPAEREAALNDLEQTRQAFLASVKGLSDAQYHWKPAPDRWSVAEVAEHITVAESGIFGMLHDKVMTTPTPPELLAQVQHDDARLRRLVTDRTEKRQAPEMLKPSGRFPNLDAVTTAFNQSRDKTEDYVKNTSDDLRGHASPHPLLKALDGYQWLLLLSAHCARHTAQIEEVKADPKFPRG